MFAGSWFHSLWTPWKQDANPEKEVVGVLAFEVTNLMSKLVNLWQSLSDKQVIKLREEITNSVGIRKLISDDENSIVGLISAEMLENIAHVAKSVARLANKCSDPTLNGFENAFNELISFGIDPYGWKFSWKKMEKKVKKMEKFVSTNASLYQEMELLADLEQTLRRIQVNGESDGVMDYQKKVAWKRQEVKNLQGISLWNRTYDYTIHLLARSLFTMFSRINHVFGIQEMVDVGEGNDSRNLNSDYILRSQSVSALLRPSVHLSENNLARFASGPLGGFTAKSGPILRTNRANIFHSGPLGDSSAKSGPISGNNKSANFYSGPLGNTFKNSVPVNGTNKRSKIWKFYGHSTTSNVKNTHARSTRLTQVGPLKGCMMAADSISVIDCHLSANDVNSGAQNTKGSNSNLAPGKVVHYSQSILSSRCKLLNPPPETLGAAALSLHYANVIIVIEKLTACPHLIGLDARDDLYNMLPVSVRSALRAKLKPYIKSMAESVYDTLLAEEWTRAMAGILEWFAPLAHNMIRWQSERSYEQQSFVSRTNVLLVQTLYFANQEKTESLITELLVGLNYVWRYGRELNAKALAECASSRAYNEYLDVNG
ncbi:hypothetical protein L6164_007324 [Bauhinia variegata]|uniref:Uncharacterized protein n=1 Tax=Bauhinia variegata TaxID=167791 RepID=A0ACB9PDD2_BAUVA|nr:hypothetical protein L6164_007324 [Bauhinia variegata]